MVAAGAAFAAVNVVAAQAPTEQDSVKAIGAGETRLPTGAATQEPNDRPTTNPQVDVNKRIRRTFEIKTNDPVFFITIDDGGYKPKGALDYIEKNQIPTTVFLTRSLVADQWDYFRRVAGQGGTVENHTHSHKSLLSSSTSLQREVCDPQQTFEEHFGARPTMLRPPYGNGGYSDTPTTARKTIDKMARSCGITNIVMWNAVAENGKVKYIRRSLTRGDIVLFHFTPGLENDLKVVMDHAKRKGLRPAPLQDYLQPS